MREVFQSRRFRWLFTLAVVFVLILGTVVFVNILNPHQQAFAMVPFVLLVVGLVSLRAIVEFTRY